MNNKLISAVAPLALLAVLPVQADNHCSHQQVRLTIPVNEMKVKPPEPKCVSEEEAFTIAISPPGKVAPGDATVVEKADVPSGITIRGENTVADPDKIYVTVTGNTDPTKTYGYIARVVGHGELDPEVRVLTSMGMLNSLMDQVDALLKEEMGFGLTELDKKQRELMKLQNDSK